MRRRGTGREGELYLGGGGSRPTRVGTRFRSVRLGAAGSIRGLCRSWPLHRSCGGPSRVGAEGDEWDTGV